MKNIIDGRRVSLEVKASLMKEIENLETAPKLVVISVGEDPASKVYIKMKEKAASAIDMAFDHVTFGESSDEEDIINHIKILNEDETVSGIIVQLPLPKKLSEIKIVNSIKPSKDVDGLTNSNLAKLFTGEDGFVPCTPLGIMNLLKIYEVDLNYKNVTVVGRSNLVGKPLLLLLLKENATVTTCHSRTLDLKEHTKNADVVIMAAGKPSLLTIDMVKDGVIVIDVGINRVDGKLVGDADFDEVSKKAALITPVPGGVGPMTVAMLMYNTVKAFKRTN